MNKSNPIPYNQDQALDKLIADSLLNKAETDSRALQVRILEQTQGLSQSSSKSKGWRQSLTAKPQLAVAASLLVGVIIVLSSYLTSRVDLRTETATSLPTSVAAIQSTLNIELETSSHVQLVWDEILLLQDELAFAGL